MKIIERKASFWGGDFLEEALHLPEPICFFGHKGERICLGDKDVEAAAAEARTPLLKPNVSPVGRFSGYVIL